MIFARLWKLIYPYRAQEIYAFRVTVAALISLAIAQYLSLPMPLWAVLTAIIVTEMRVGRSLKTAVDYLGGTIGGAVYGTLVSILVPHVGEVGFLVVIAVAIAPLTFLMAANPSLKVAPITAVLVIMIPAITHTSSLTSAVDRITEVGLGAAAGFIITTLIVPSRTHRIVTETASRTVDQIADAVGKLMAGLETSLDMAALHRIQDGIGQAIFQLEAIAREADRERATRVNAEPEAAPLVRTLLRLRHDLVIIGRITLAPMPAPLMERLRGPLNRSADAVGGYLHGIAQALLSRRPPPSFVDVEAALSAYSAEVTALHSGGLTQGLSGEAAEHFFVLGFALDQFRQNLRDIGERVTEWADKPKRKTSSSPAVHEL